MGAAEPLLASLRPASAPSSRLNMNRSHGAANLCFSRPLETGRKLGRNSCLFDWRAEKSDSRSRALSGEETATRFRDSR
jgi:hypothetical protein